MGCRTCPVPRSSSPIRCARRAGHAPTEAQLTAASELQSLNRSSPRPVGCVGLRRLDARTRELTRLFVRPGARGAGVAALLLAAAEQRARADGASVIRLNTRSDLVEARALYAGHGYREIPRYGDDPLAGHWFEKKLWP